MAVTKKKAAKRTVRETPAQERKRLTTEKVELQLKLDEANTELAVKQEEQVDAVLAQNPIPEREFEGTSDLADPELIFDPFAGQNPHAIKADPPGFVLGWKSERYRERRGMRGWIEVAYDDEYGQNLDQYINDPPHRMKHQTDMIVRRGDVLLCRLPVSIWKARQQQRVDKANRLARDHADDIQVDEVVHTGALLNTNRNMLR